MMKMKKKCYKKIKEKNLSQPRLTWLTHHTRHEIGIKKIDSKKRAKQKWLKLNKKNITNENASWTRLAWLTRSRNNKIEREVKKYQNLRGNILMEDNEIEKKKVITNWGKKTESIKVNSTDPPPVTWDQDKKKSRLRKEEPSKKY